MLARRIADRQLPREHLSRTLAYAVRAHSFARCRSFSRSSLAAAALAFAAAAMMIPFLLTHDIPASKGAPADGSAERSRSDAKNIGERHIRLRISRGSANLCQNQVRRSRKQTQLTLDQARRPEPGKHGGWRPTERQKWLEGNEAAIRDADEHCAKCGLFSDEWIPNACGCSCGVIISARIK